MAVALSCRCCEVKVMGSGSTGQVRVPSPASVESTVPSAETTGAAPLSVSRVQSKENSVDDSPASRGLSRLATMATAAAASIAVLSANPAAVLAGDLERGVSGGALITHSIPDDLSLSIAIPIPDPDTWTNSQSGFLAPPPHSRGGRAGSGVVMMNYQGGCPAWQPSQFEMIVPDGVHSKHNSRHGSQWPANYRQEKDAATTEQTAAGSADPKVQYESLIDTLLRMSDAGLTCFSL